MVDLGVLFPFSTPYRLPEKLPKDLSSFRIILLPEDAASPVERRLAAFTRAGGFVHRMKDAQWENESFIERVVVRGGLRAPHPAMWARMEAIPDSQIIETACARILEYLRGDWHDVLRYFIECLTAAHEITGRRDYLDHAGKLVALAMAEKPPFPATCDHVSVIYAALGYMRAAGTQEYLPLCRQVIDEYMRRAPRWRGVFSNFADPEQAGIARAEIAFQFSPALARFAAMTGERRYADIAVEQILLSDKLLRDRATGLWRIGRGQGGQTPCLWARGSVFAFRGVIDTLEELSRCGAAAVRCGTAQQQRSAATAPGCAPIVNRSTLRLLPLARRMSASLCALQGPTGVWFQVLDDPASRDEMSATTWAVAGLLKGVRMGYLDRGRLPVALNGWRAAKRRFWDGFSTRICGGTGASVDPDYFRHRHFLPCSYGHFHLLAATEVARLASPDRIRRVRVRR